MRLNIKLKHKTRDVTKHTERVRDVFLDRVSGQTIQFARRSMRDAPKRADAPKYDIEVTTTFKSGRRKGQERRYVRRGMHSAPGTPPRYHAQSQARSLKNMRPARISATTSIAGPLYFRSEGNRTTSEPIPHVHEFGGTFTRKVRWAAKKRKKRRLGQPATKAGWKRYNASLKKPKGSEIVPAKSVSSTVTYPDRPYMAPAHKKAIAWLRRNGTRLARNAI